MKFTNTKDPLILANLNKPVQDLHHQKYPHFFKPFEEDVCVAFFERQLEKPNWVVFLVQIDGENAGYASYFIKDYQENPFRKAYRSLYVDQICVLDKFKGKGIGKHIMHKIEEDARKADISQIELSYWEMNKEARGFYEHLGYNTYSRIVGKSLD